MDAPETWMQWLETKGPLWSLYGAVVYFVVRYAPVLFQKHCTMLDTATESMAKSASAIQGINEHVEQNRGKLHQGQKAIAEASKPAMQAFRAITPDSKRHEVEPHLREIERILSDSVRE